MANKNTGKNIAIGSIIVLVIAMLVFVIIYFSKQTFLQPTPNFLTQYAGLPDTFNANNFDWIETLPISLDFGETAVIGDYKIIVQKSHRGQKLSEPFCSTNTCSGTQIGTDGSNCPLYSGSGSASVNHNIGSTCGSTGCGKCNSETFDFGGQVLSCNARTNGDAIDVGCTPSGNSIQCGGCLRLKSGGSSGSVTCDVSFVSQCGGVAQSVVYESNNQCWAKGDIYYNEAKIYDISWDVTRSNVAFKNGVKVPNNQADLLVEFHTDDQYVGGTCRTIVSDYTMQLPPQSFQLNISATKKEVVQGEIIKVNISIDNFYGKPMLANLIVDFEVPTTIGSARRTDEKIITIPTGHSEHFFEIPSQQATDKLIATPTIDFLMKGTQFSGINGICYRQEINKDKPLAGCEYVEIGTISESPFEVRIISETEALKGKISELESDISFLELSIAEKAKYITDLNLNLQEQAGLIRQLQLKSTEQAELISALNLNIQQEAELITALQLKSSEQADLIASLELSIAQKIELINELELKASEMAEAITKLNLNIQQQASAIKQMEDKIAEQASIIDNMGITLSQEAELIDAMNLEINDQLTLINNLNLNLLNKIALVNMLNIENEEQKQLNEQMRGSFAEQASVINNLELTIDGDAEYIRHLDLSLAAQAGVISELNLKIEDMARLITQLKLDKDQLTKLVSELQLTITEYAELIKELKLNVEDSALIIGKLKLSAEQDAELINKLKLNVGELAELVSRLKLTNEEQARLIDGLELNLQEKIELVKQLKLKIEEEQALLTGLQKGIPVYVWFIVGAVVVIAIAGIIIARRKKKS